MNAADVVLRSSVILAVGLVAQVLLSRRSAALRHCVLAGTIFMAAAIVPLSLTVPSWNVRLPAWAHQQAQVSSVITVAATRSAAQAPSSSTRSDVARLAIVGWTVGFAMTALLLLV